MSIFDKLFGGKVLVSADLAQLCDRLESEQRDKRAALRELEERIPAAVLSTDKLNGAAGMRKEAADLRASIAELEQTLVATRAAHSEALATEAAAVLAAQRETAAKHGAVVEADAKAVDRLIGELTEAVRQLAADVQVFARGVPEPPADFTSALFNVALEVRFAENVVSGGLLRRADEPDPEALKRMGKGAVGAAASEFVAIGLRGHTTDEKPVATDAPQQEATDHAE